MHLKFSHNIYKATWKAASTFHFHWDIIQGYLHLKSVTSPLRQCLDPYHFVDSLLLVQNDFLFKIWHTKHAPCSKYFYNFLFDETSPNFLYRQKSIPILLLHTQLTKTHLDHLPLLLLVFHLPLLHGPHVSPCLILAALYFILAVPFVLD